MVFNASKCKVIHFGKNNPKYSYTMGGFAPGGTVLESSKEDVMNYVTMLVISDLSIFISILSYFMLTLTGQYGQFNFTCI